MAGEEIQIENGGYTRIHNAILETLAKAQLAPLEFKIVLFILRKTYGFQKKTDVISISQFEECGAGRANTFEALNNLLRLRVIIREAVSKQRFSYGLNKYFETWLPEAFETRYIGRGDNFHKKTIPPVENETVSPVENSIDEETVSPVENETVSPVDRTVSPVGIKPLAPMRPTKEIKKLTKETLKKDGDLVPIPEKLSTQEFIAEWDEWLAFRKQIRHTATITTQKKQLNYLSGFSPPIAISMLEQSMLNGWQGIFEVKGNGKYQKPNPDELPILSDDEKEKGKSEWRRLQAEQKARQGISP